MGYKRYNKNMEFKLPEYVRELMEKFESKGYEIYVVGGAIRDLITKREVDDWDFTTNATPEEILKVLPGSFYDNKFGTVGLSHKSSNNPYEITTFRTEYGYSDSRRPDKVVWGKSLSEDLERRDFTINAMALSNSLELIDPFEGKKDLERKIIKTVGSPNERFGEDALRMMRAVRIATELGFNIEDKTLEGIKKNVSLLNKIAKERVKEELFKVLASSYPYEGIVLFRSTGLLAEIIPEMEKTFGVEQKSPGRHHIYDVGTHSMLSLKYVAEKNLDPVVRLATLIHDIGKPQTMKKMKNGTITFYNHEVVSTSIAKKLAERLKFSRKETARLVKLVRWHQFTVDEKQTDASIRRFIKKVGIENIEDILDLRVGDRLGGGARETSWRLEEFKERLVEVQKQPFTVHDLKVDGADVMKKLNLKPGPEVGKILDKLFVEVVEKKLPNEKKELLLALEKD